MLLAVAIILAFAGVAYVRQRSDPPAMKMAIAAEKFVESLTPEQKKKALIDFDSPERTNWHFVPLQDKEKRSTRKGLPLKDMNPQQKHLALALLEAGTSDTGNRQATTIMSLELILREQEKNGANVRDPEWYFFSIFGTPGKSGQWGWRVEGHHLSINYTIGDAQVLAATPTFFGANPATVKDGPKKGERILPQAEDYAIGLFKSLNDDQRKIAMQEKAFGEPKAQAVKSGITKQVGIMAGTLDSKQRDMLMKLVASYAKRLQDEVAAVELKAVQDAGTDKISFAYSGGTEPGQGHTYRVHGPTFVIEFLNVQADSAGNPNNHIHSCWRKPDGDFGIKAK
jgi:hypothetical protein